MNDRISRALNERIYLLKAEHLPDKWNFGVKGQSNKVYKVDITINSPCKCNCMDFILRKKICKHLIFITERIAKISSITHSLIDNNHLSELDFQRLSKTLEEKLLDKRKVQEEKEPDTTRKLSESDEDCFICFESLTGETLVQCVTTCKNYFHEECLTIWLSKNKTCPLCRAHWIDPSTIKWQSGEDDALSFLNKKH